MFLDITYFTISQFHTGLSGCIAELKIGRRPLNRDKFTENVVKIVNTNMDGCPRGRSNATSCMNDLPMSTVYNGTSNATVDSGLKTFTGEFYP